MRFSKIDFDVDLSMPTLEEAIEILRPIKHPVNQQVLMMMPAPPDKTPSGQLLPDGVKKQMTEAIAKKGLFIVSVCKSVPDVAQFQGIEPGAYCSLSQGINAGEAEKTTKDGKKYRLVITHAMNIANILEEVDYNDIGEIDKEKSDLIIKS